MPRCRRSRSIAAAFRRRHYGMCVRARRPSLFCFFRSQRQDRGDGESSAEKIGHLSPRRSMTRKGEVVYQAKLDDMPRAS